jgi:hypothetical protein
MTGALIQSATSVIMTILARDIHSATAATGERATKQDNATPIEYGKAIK